MDTPRMQALFSPAGEQAIARLLQQRALLAFDFDGTLAPIVSNPAHAQTPYPLAQYLDALSQRHPVAIITGRQVADVKGRLGFQPRFVVGNHGAEGLGWTPTSNALDELRQRLGLQEEALDAMGVEVEDKGLSLALHFRNAQNPAEAERFVLAATDALPSDLVVFGGKFVANVVYRSAPDKGQAALQLLRTSGCETMLFVGDDLNDESAFARAPEDAVTVRIGQPRYPSQAKFFLASQDEMGSFLARVLDAAVGSTEVDVS